MSLVICPLSFVFEVLIPESLGSADFVGCNYQ
jgi:hypothetical protein